MGQGVVDERTLRCARAPIRPAGASDAALELLAAAEMSPLDALQRGRLTRLRAQIAFAPVDALLDGLTARFADGYVEGAIGEAGHQRTDATREPLTAQEAGRTNSEIGAELFLSPRTAEWHLRKVFAKLDAASRRELCAVPS
ncbi:regulatory LuxR family protein [Lentzea atacamensis]|uniref:Regulatory LuxR family protein n=1 Tax=Lentzea atacamensis TaxID=531938 RepID=A0A316HS98_9PSEU|nr:regulatory LuxR family protein [Lentzea atacamensis]